MKLSNKNMTLKLLKIYSLHNDINIIKKLNIIIIVKIKIIMQKKYKNIYFVDFIIS